MAITKLDATKRQIEAAIRMTLAAEDRLAIHAVVSAAAHVLHDLAEQSGGVAYHELVKAHIVPGKEKEFLESCAMGSELSEARG